MKLARLCLLAGVAALALLHTAAKAAPITGPTIWIDDKSGNIGKVNTATGAVTMVGPTGYSLTDIAFDPSGNLWGITLDNLVKINKNTAAVTFVGWMGTDGANALTFGSDGTLYAAGITNTKLYTVNTTTGFATIKGDTGFFSNGDLAFNSGKLYMADSHNHLININLTTSAGTDLGATGYDPVFGLATAMENGILYGVAGTKIFTVNTTTGAGSLTSVDYGGGSLGQAYGAAFEDEAGKGSTVPLPTGAWAGMILIGGLALTHTIARRRTA